MRTISIAIIVSFLFMISIFASDIYVPALPEMAESLNASQLQMELSVALYFLSFAVSQLFYGPLSDRFGRKPIILTGLGIALLGSIVCMFASDGFQLILGRLIQAAGMGAPMSLGRVILRDLFKGMALARWNSYIGVFSLLAPALAPILGGYLAYTWGWPAIFIFLIIFIAMLGITSLVFLPETRAEVTEPLLLEFHEIFTHYKVVIKNNIFLAYAITAAITLSGMVVYLTLSSFLFQEKLGLTMIEYSWVSVFVSAALILGVLANVGLLYYFHFNQLIILGLIIKCISGLLLLAALLFDFFNPISLIASVFLFSFACSLVFSNASSGVFTSFNHRLGLVGALYGTIQMLMAGIVGAIASFAKNDAEWVLAAAFLLLGIIGLLSFLKLIDKKVAT